MSRYTVSLDGPEGKIELGFPSVTEIIDATYSKRGLEDWYYKQGVSGIALLMEKYGENLPNDVPSLHSLLKSEGFSPYSQRDSAADAGKAIHTAVKELTSGKTAKAKAHYPALYSWWKERDFRRANILGAEQTLVSFKYRFAGTADLVYTEGGLVTLSDVKSGAVRDSHHLQLEGYRMAWEEMGGHPVDQLSIIQVPRDGSAVNETLVSVSEELSAAWMGMLAVYEWTKPRKRSV
jgi:hypothetical protein